MKVLCDLYALLLSRIHVIARHISTMTSLMEASSAPNKDGTASDAPLFALSTLVPASTELANARASKLLGLRTQAHAALPLKAFLEVYQASWDFVVASEVLARRMIVGLRGVVVGQAKAWLAAFHAQRITDGAKAVEDEVWAQVEVSGPNQDLVDRIIDGAVEDPKEFVIPVGDSVNGSTDVPNGHNHLKADSAASKQPQLNGKLLKIEERTYFVVAATLQVLELLAGYLKVIVNLSSLTTDAMARVIEFLKVSLVPPGLRHDL